MWQWLEGEMSFVFTIDGKEKSVTVAKVKGLPKKQMRESVAWTIKQAGASDEDFNNCINGKMK